MKERGLIMQAVSVFGILDDRKTQTRRLITPQPAFLQHHEWRGKVLYDEEHRLWWWKQHSFENLLDFEAGRRELAALCPHGQPGDRLWVKETHAQFSVGNRTGISPQCVAYRATCDDDGGFDYVNNGDEIMRLRVTKWTPSIFMPRWASRTTLELVEIRVQRLQEISEDDAVAEGMVPFFTRFPKLGRDQRLTSGELARVAEHRASYAVTWDEINRRRATWASNPFVWALTFRRPA